LREKLAAVLIIPFSWGSQLDGEKPSTTYFFTVILDHIVRRVAQIKGFRGIENKKIPTKMIKNKLRSNLRDAKQ
jgi:hypothetical protein